MFFNKKAKLLKAKEEELATARTEMDTVKNALQNCEELNNELQNRYSAIIDKDNVLKERQTEIENTQKQLHELNAKYQFALKVHANLEEEISLYQDTLEIGSFGLYKPQFDFDTSEKYKQWLQDNYESQKRLIKEDAAVICSTEWTVGGSKSEGKKMTNQYKKLMLFAFNGDCDSFIAKVKWNNASKSKERIQKSYDSINKLGSTQNTEITRAYLRLNFRSLHLHMNTNKRNTRKKKSKEE